MIEQKIDELRAAVEKLTTALERAATPTALERAATPTALERAATPTAETPAPKAEKPKAEKPKAEKPKAEKPEPKPEEPPAQAVTRPMVAQALIGLMKAKGQDAGVAVLKEFGAARVPDLKEADFPAVLAAIEAASA